MKGNQLIVVLASLATLIILYFAPTKSDSLVAVKASENQLTVEQRIKKAISIIQSGNAPMEGISLLKSVVEEDPSNVEAIMWLGLFSIQSGQYEKAVSRFEKITQIDPQNKTAHLKLAESYLSLRDTLKATSYYKSYKALLEDNAEKDEIETVIRKLSNK